MLSHNTLYVIIVVLIIGLIILYNYNKTNTDTMTGSINSQYSNVEPANEDTFKEQSASFKEVNKPNYVNDLLPSINNNEWSEFNPNITGEIDNINKFKAGTFQGIDTIGSSFRNANLQLRSEPPNPIVPTGPWNQSTITHDFIRTPFEIGSRDMQQ
jgi:hypothetical protein